MNDKELSELIYNYIYDKELLDDFKAYLEFHGYTIEEIEIEED